MRPYGFCAAQAIAGEPLAAALPAACALGSIHTYSLIHDLPAWTMTTTAGAGYKS